MRKITVDDLQVIMPLTPITRARMFCEPLNQAMRDYDISTPARQAAFLAQIAHESGSLNFTREIASGRAYEGRVDLGNTEPGDGERFRGRGLMQITGRANYAACSEALFQLDLLLRYPPLLETALVASLSAAWFWRARGLNELADLGNFERITRRINGGLNGQAQRLQFWVRAKSVLAAGDQP